jgi:cytochrome c oxidase subunit 2
MIDIFSHLFGGRMFPVAPPQASEHAFWYDLLFLLITLLTVLFTVLVLGAVLIIANRYRVGKVVDRRNPSDHDTKLELLWTGVPLILAMGIFTFSAVNFLKVRTMPKDPLDVFVIGKQWMWHVQHMNGIRENSELTIPVGRDVKLTMISQDVIHAMYIPAFRAQYHVVPGRYTQLAFKPTRIGRYPLLCAMHCGTQHSEMVGFVNVLSEKDFAEWQAKGGNRFKPTARTMKELGARKWKEKNCGQCHGSENTVKGPSLAGLSGKTRRFTNGTTMAATDDYIRASILEPWNLINAGWDRTMPAYKGQLTEEDVLGLMSYIKSLGVGGAATGPDAPAKLYQRDIPRNYKTNEQPDNATDNANKAVSAGAAHSREIQNQ